MNLPRPLATHLCLFVNGAVILVAALASAQAQRAEIGEGLAKLLETANRVAPPAAGAAAGAVEPAEAPRVGIAEDGFLQYLGAPPLHHFPVASAVAGKPDQTARSFLLEHGPLFGVASREVDFALAKAKNNVGRSNVRLQQTYGGIPVFAAEVSVQVSGQDGIEAVLSSIARDLKSLDEKRLSVKPAISADDAAIRIGQWLAQNLAPSR